MRQRFIATLIAIMSLGLLLTPAAVGPAQAAAGKAIFTVAPPTTVYDNQDITFTVDFPTGTYDEGIWGNYPYLQVQKSTDGTTFVPVAPGIKSSSAGVLAMTYNVGADQHWIKVCNDVTKPNGQTGRLFNDLKSEICTPTVELDPQVPPPSGAALTVQPDGKKATATFTGAAAKSGQSASLQIQTIVTTMTNEVTTATWKTIATATQSSSGVATFSVSNPYEVEHTYRAITGTSPQYISNEVSVEPPAPAKATGVAQAYFNTNEQASVNTRTRYFEGEFTLKQAASSVKYASCTPAMAKGGGEVVTVAQKAAMKGRGNYSWSFDKKSFTLKLDSKRNLCGMGTSKKWALVANHYDKSLMRNTMAQYVGSKLTDMAWTPDSIPVDFWMNGSYRGSYILVERIEGNTEAPRLPYKTVGDNRTIANPADTPGFLLEWDFREGADYNVTVGSRGYVGIKDPEIDYDEAGVNEGTGITKAQRDYINSYLDSCDAKLFGSGFAGSSGWRTCIDEKSAVDYYIGMELMKPVDGNMWASVYMWKPANQKLQFGPMWDFDLAAGSANRAGNVVSPSGWYLRNVLSISAKQSTKTWFNRLNEDPGFRSAVRARYRDLYDNHNLKGQVLSYLDDERGRISATASENFKLWSVTEHLSSVQVVKGSWSAEVSYLRSWLNTRMTWMRSNV